MSTRIKYVRWLPFGIAGVALKHIILIHRDHKDCVSLHKHEEKHIEQQRGQFFPLWVLRYFCSRKFRMRVEAEAYHVSYKTDGMMSKHMKALTENYNLNITYREAEHLIERG